MSEKPTTLSIDEIESIREKAESLARTPMMHPVWKRAYERLADSADNLALLNLRTRLAEEG